MSNYTDSSFLDGLGLPQEEIDALRREREELIEIIGQVNSFGNWIIDARIVDAILAAGWRKQKPK
jgi:hypothetical protein